MLVKTHMQGIAIPLARTSFYLYKITHNKSVIELLLNYIILKKTNSLAIK